VVALSSTLVAHALDVKGPRGSFTLKDQSYHGQVGFCAADLASSLKGSLSRDEVSKYPVLTIEGHRILVSTASALASVDGKIVKLQVAPSQRDDCLWLPAEFLASVLPRVLGGPVVVTGARAAEIPAGVKVEPKVGEAEKGEPASIHASVAADNVRITLQGRTVSRAEVTQSAKEVFVTLPEANFPGSAPVVGKGIVDSVAVEPGGRRLRVILGPGFKRMEFAKLRNPDRLVLLFKGEGQRLATVDTEPSTSPAEAAEPLTTAAQPLTSEPPKVTAAFDTVILDPGHGGPDTGAASASGLLEKNLTLSLAQKTAALLEKEGIRAILTRSTDQQVPLIQRTAIANYNRADLLLSIHLNASPVPSAGGTETYYMSRQATDLWSTQLAAKENAAGLDEVPPAGGGLNLVLWEMAQTSALVESAALAETIQEEFNALLGTSDRGVRQAPFAVLEGAQMPAVRKWPSCPIPPKRSGWPSRPFKTRSLPLDQPS
jgi:N-acetylmuramoyl-L-alanine amidase